MPKIYQRLLCFSEEPNVGRGFIKEQSFSADGRLIASPHGSGVRLLAFSSDFRELCDCDDLACLAKNSRAPSRPKISKLVPTGVTLNPDSSKIVLCTKFSPTHLLLASGCLGGNVSFHQPVL
uniref:Uncharacterized protein n=1 Tax=Romanomermis culicivorax TaxID=13658 RepID=A0A915L1V0_ROMCU